MKKKALNLVKLLAGILILVYILFYKTNPAQIFEVLKSASVPLVILSLSLHSIGIYVSALRWKLILNETNEGYSTWDLSKSYLVSNFFNLFLSRFGGDVVRIADTRKTEKGLAKSTAVVLVERLSGVFVLVIFAISAALIKLDFVKDIPQIIYPIALAVAGLVVFFIVWKVLPGDFFTRFNFSNSFINKLFSKFAKLHSSILEALSNRTILIKATGYSIILQLNVIIHFYLIGLSEDFYLN